MSEKTIRRTLSAILAIAVVLAAMPLIGMAASATTTISATGLTGKSNAYGAELWRGATLPHASVLDSGSASTNATVDETIRIFHTLDLASDISVSFAVLKSALTDYNSYYLECSLPEYQGNEQIGTSTIKIDPTDKGNYYYFTLTGITAVRMGDTVEAVLHMTKGGTKYVSKTDSYSVATYAYAMLDKTTDSKMLTLCADLLRYGAEAQSYKNYRTDALVDAAMTEEQRAYLSGTESLTFTSTDIALGDLENPTITWVGKTLDLGSKVGMKFVFNTTNYTGDIANLSMKVTYEGSTGDTKTVILTGADAYNASRNYYAFTFYGLLAAELRAIVDVAIYEGETQLTETLRYSAETYAAKTLGTALEPLCRALFAYSDSAKTVFTPQPVTYTVTFKDWDGTVLKTETVESGKSATAPADPSRTGYTFTGWDTSFETITSNLVVTATYLQNAQAETYTVTFYDYDGVTVLGTSTVRKGDAATLPPAPSKAGADFIGWSGNYTNVSIDESVIAVYNDSKNVFTVESASGNVGDTVTLLVSVDGKVKTCGFDMTIYYDNTMLYLVSHDSELDLDVVANAAYLDNGVLLNFSAATEKTKRREIIALTFRIKDTTATATSVTVEMTSIKEIEGTSIIDSSFKIVEGVVTIQ